MEKDRKLYVVKELSEDWEYIQDHETRLLRSVTIRESMKQYQELQTAFEWQVQQTADLFETDHRQALVELQNRLCQLVLWQSNHGQSLSINPEDSEVTA